jgi:DNA-directed RNA polymerase sigma subunit (sigma70/sigma32)
MTPTHGESGGLQEQPSPYCPKSSHSGTERRLWTGEKHLILGLESLFFRVPPYPENVSADQDDEYVRRAAAAPKMGDPAAAGKVALAQGGDLHAHAQLLVSHRRIVAKLVKRYAETGPLLDERIRLGEQGLGVAIDKFNPVKGFSFSTYATWWIRRAITMDLGDDGGGAAVTEPWTPKPSPGSAPAAR